jgi:hypothetical protein
LRRRTANSFWPAYERLPEEIQKLAVRNFALLEADPHHPSLRFRPVGRFWSARVGRDYRATAVRRGDDCIWFWIGSHAEYDRLIRSG